MKVHLILNDYFSFPERRVKNVGKTNYSYECGRQLLLEYYIDNRKLISECTLAITGGTISKSDVEKYNEFDIKIIQNIDNYAQDFSGYLAGIDSLTKIEDSSRYVFTNSSCPVNLLDKLLKNFLQLNNENILIGPGYSSIIKKTKFPWIEIQPHIQTYCFSLAGNNIMEFRNFIINQSYFLQKTNMTKKDFINLFEISLSKYFMNQLEGLIFIFINKDNFIFPLVIDSRINLFNFLLDLITIKNR
jgi:hypothetical protein